MDQKILAKIKKCFDLAKSTNPHEAAIALDRAHKLMAKYGIAQKEVDYADIISVSTVSTIPEKPPVHTKHLFTSISWNFGVRTIITCRYPDHKIKWYVDFVGEKDAAKLAAYSFDVIYRQLLRSRAEYIKTLHHRLKRINKTRRADEFCRGWVHEACDRMAEMDISDHYRETIKSFIADKYGETTSLVTTNREGRYDDYAAGVLAAGDVYLNSPVNGQEYKKLR